MPAYAFERHTAVSSIGQKTAWYRTVKLKAETRLQSWEKVMRKCLSLPSHSYRKYVSIIIFSNPHRWVCFIVIPSCLRAQVAFPQITPAFPVFDGLHPRQDSNTCAGDGYTLCPDGSGCCPSGVDCTSTISGGNVHPRCAVACNGGPICTTPIRGCCLRGLKFGSDELCNTPTGTNTEVVVSTTPPTARSFQQITPTTAPENPTTASPASISSAFGEASSSIKVSLSAEESSLGTS